LLRLVSDENFHGDIVRGLRRRFPDIDFVRVQDVGLSGIDDPSLLTWCSEESRILLTHDRATIPFFAADRLLRSLRVSGIFIVDDRASLGHIIDELALAIECSEQVEWVNLIMYFPFALPNHV
jgi:hypothetical protein